jgi:hypothetical protein
MIEEDWEGDRRHERRGDRDKQGGEEGIRGMGKRIG